MTSSQFSPLERNPTTGELFLRLSSPYENIILTPPRTSDAAAIAAIMNDPAVHPWLARLGATFSLEDAEKLVEEFKLASDSVIEALEDAARTAQALVITQNCPVRSIRELQPDGTDVYIGNIAFKRCTWPEVQGSERDRLMAENNAKPTGDPKIIWQVSDFLASSHHRRGIMTVVLGTMLKEWAIPRMRVHCLHVSVFTGNNGSVRVFEKNGFVLVGTLEDCIEIRGEKRSLHILDWKHVAE
ncbi:N-acetyltransferase domain-containing protein [Mycena sanguinolenta]|uniref:N-acetyltransferase domain-containing protein n=1 Tax=Mycena sanguinolenta TaxID=230812 RepID=A0A8H6YIP5_9AGAR|nr:N-acetyltransferase domain-containing protein [Mycena sanguinolenta]